jgi:hypothetical protein
MSTQQAILKYCCRYWGLVLVMVTFILNPSQARGYFYHRSGAGVDDTHSPVGAGTIIKWRPGTGNWVWNSGAKTGIWDDANQTLHWHFNPIDFSMSTTWPTIAAAGAAFENSYKTIQDTTGTVLKIVREADSTGTPTINDGRLDMCLNHDENSSILMPAQSIAGAFAVTWVQSSGGNLTDADIEVNGDPKTFPNWATTGPPAPANSNDIETTTCHEQLHSIGAGHPIYFYAMVWPQGRVPETLQYDRCLSPDDRMVIRTLYPAASAFGTINGNVALFGGGPAAQAVIVATDAAGIPQATWVTDDAGNYSINVPAGTYTVTAHHHLNSTYSSDIDFLTASGFVTSTTSGATAVAAGGAVNNVNLTATAGTPTMTLTNLGMNGATLNSETLFLAKGSSGTIQLEITPAFGSAVTSLTLSSNTDVTATNVTVTPAAGTSVVSANFAVAANAVAGVRNISLMRADGERLFLPSYIEVLDTGTLTVAASAGNPVAGVAAFSTVDRPLLGVSLTASAVEDIRIHQLQFKISGTGPTLPAVRLWIDNGTIGVVDAGDVRVFSGNAYANNPVAETTPVTPPGVILFDNLALTVLAGQTVHLLLTADIPAGGSGDYVASFDPTSTGEPTSTYNLEAHGMFWGDLLLPPGATPVPDLPNGLITGGTVTGGAQTMGTLAIGSLQQIRTTAGTVIPVGGVTSEPGLQVTLQGTATSSTTTVGMDVEIKPVGVAFTNTPTASSATTFASGAQISLNVAVANQTSYHWQARPTSPTLAPGAWQSFGGNPDPGGVDFTVDTSTTGLPSALAQFLADGVTPVPLGGSAGGAVVLSATRGMNSAGSPVSLEFEVQPAGTPFTGTANLPATAFSVGGVATVTFTGSTGFYHWQVRSVGQFGSASAFFPFNASANHFRLDLITASAGCFGRVATGSGAGWMLGSAAGVALLALSFWRRAARKFAGALVLVFCFGAAARADEESPLPRSIDEWSEVSPLGEAEALTILALAEPAPTLAAGSSWISFDAYLGMIFMNMAFNTTGADSVNRVVKGIGTGAFGLEALVTLAPAWRVGLAAEIDYWSDLRVLAGGVVGTWRFMSSPTMSPAGRPDLEHLAKAGVYYESLTISVANFGSFSGTVGARLGYELRIAIATNWSFTAGAEVVYSKWKYSPAVLTGDTSIGGIGGLITVGIALIP